MEIGKSDTSHHLNLLVASIDDLVFEVAASGIILNYWVSDEGKLFYEPDFFIGKSVRDLFPETLAATFLTQIDLTLKNRAAGELDYESPFESHKKSWYRMKIRPIHSLYDRVAVVISDITDRYEIQEKMRRSEWKFNRAFHGSGVGMALVNTSGRYIEVNRTLLHLLGYTAEEMCDMHISNCTHPEDLPENVKVLRKMEAGELEFCTIEKRYRHKDGHYIWASLSLSAVHDISKGTIFIGQIQDITAAKQSRETLASGKAQLEKAMSDLEMRRFGSSILKMDWMRLNTSGLAPKGMSPLWLS